VYLAIVKFSANNLSIDIQGIFPVSLYFKLCTVKPKNVSTAKGRRRHGGFRSPSIDGYRTPYPVAKKYKENQVFFLDIYYISQKSLFNLLCV
jgi:hypothetical protein